MPKVLHIRASGQLLGAERVVLELAQYLPKHGYQPIVGVPLEASDNQAEFANAAQQLGFETEIFPVTGAFDLSIAKKIRQYVRENGIDIIHCHGYREDLYAVLARSGAKLVATNHLWKRTTLRLKIYAALDAFLLRFFPAIIAVSKPVYNDMIKVGLKESQCSVVSNGIDTQAYASLADKYVARRVFDLDEKSFIIGTLSSLTVEKGINYLVDAAQEIIKTYPQCHLLIVGNGPEMTSLQSQAKTLGISHRITFAGRRSDITNVLSAIDVFALPSLDEGLPMAMLEAMAAGKAVIASDVGDVSVALTPTTGRLVEAKNTAQLIQEISMFIANPEEIETLGQKAKQRVNDHFSSESMSKQYAKIYDQVLGLNK